MLPVIVDAASALRVSYRWGRRSPAGAPYPRRCLPEDQR